MASTFLNISTDSTLGGDGSSDSLVASQKAIKSYIDNHSGGSGIVDSALSITSTNPVQNKVITLALSDISASLNLDSYLDLIIDGNTSELPNVIQSSYESDLNDIIGGTYVNV